MYTFELPSGPEIELREMTGAEEELLTNQRLIRTGDAVNQVLANCILRIGENAEPAMTDVLNMLSGDRLFTLVRLRQISLGDEVELDLVCPNTACRAKNHIVVNLNDLPVTPYGEEREFALHAARLRQEGEVRPSRRQQGEAPGADAGADHLLRNADPHSGDRRHCSDQESARRDVDA